MQAEVPVWQRIVVPIGFVIWLMLVPGAWLGFRLTGSEGDMCRIVFEVWPSQQTLASLCLFSEGDMYEPVFGVLVLFSGAVWLCVGVPLAILSFFNRLRWGRGLHALALAPLLAFFCFWAYFLFLRLSAL